MTVNRTLLALTCLGTVVGCRTNKDILNDYGKSLADGHYAKPIEEIAGKAKGGGVDELMWRLHLGSSHYLTQVGQKAICEFDRAEDLFAEHDGQSVVSKATDTTFAMLTNDRTLTFKGMGEDRIFTCLYKAIDYGVNGDLAAMRTELNRAAEHQNLWLEERRFEIAKAEKQLEEAVAYEKDEASKRGAAGDFPSGISVASSVREKVFADADFGKAILGKCGFDPAVDGRLEDLARKDWINAYAEHVTGVFRWLSGDSDAALYLRETAALRPANTFVQTDYATGKAQKKPANKVWVFVEDGLCPMREEFRIDLPLALIPYANRYVRYAGMALPYLQDRAAGCTSYGLDAGGVNCTLEEIEDVDRLVKTEYKVYMRGCLAREITRTIVKIGTQVATGIAADNANDSRVRGVLRMMVSASAVWAASVTQADLRSWTALPKRVLMCSVARPEDGVLRLSGDGRPVAEISVPEGNSMVFVRKPGLAAAPVVKVVPIPARR